MTTKQAKQAANKRATAGAEKHQPVEGGIETLAMLARLSLRYWHGTKIDKAVAGEVADQKGAQDSTVGKYYKRLISDDRLDKLLTTRNQIRNAHYEMTLPWLHDGLDILPAAMFDGYVTKLRTLQDEYKRQARELVDDFKQNRKALLAREAVRLGELFNETDYPTPAGLAGKFDCIIEFFPVPVGADFRVQGINGKLAEVQAQIDEAVQRAEQHAVKALADRMAEAVGRMVERLSNPKGIFRDSMVENVRELVDALPRLNFTGNDKIATLARQMEELTKHDPDTLRGDASVRQATAQKAEAIAEAIKSIY